MTFHAARRRMAITVLCTVLMVSQILFWLGVFFALYYLIPQAKDAAADSGALVSRQELLLFYASDWFVNYFYVGVPLLLAGLGATTGALLWIYRALLPPPRDAEA